MHDACTCAWSSPSSHLPARANGIAECIRAPAMNNSIRTGTGPGEAPEQALSASWAPLFPTAHRLLIRARHRLTSQTLQQQPASTTVVHSPQTGHTYLWGNGNLSFNEFSPINSPYPFQSLVVTVSTPQRFCNCISDIGWVGGETERKKEGGKEGEREQRRKEGSKEGEILITP